MTRAWLLMLLVGCTVEEDLSTTSSELTVDDLEAQSYTCTPNDPWGATHRCFLTAGNRYTNYRCDDLGCELLGVWKPLGTFEKDLNYGFEPEQTIFGGTAYKQAQLAASAGAHLVMVDGTSTSMNYFDVLDASTVYAWIRVWAPSEAANSIYFQVDNTPAERWTIPATAGYQWQKVEIEPQKRWSRALAPGLHFVKLVGDEPGVWIDRIVLASNPDFVPVTQYVQVESGRFTLPMRAASGGIPPTSYGWVPPGAGSNGRVDLDIVVPWVGYYNVWARANAPAYGDNRIHLGWPLNQATPWSLPLTSSGGWTFSSNRQNIDGSPRVFKFDGWDVLPIVQLDDGVRVDKLFVTNDPGFSLVEASPPLTTGTKR